MKVLVGLVFLLLAACAHTVAVPEQGRYIKGPGYTGVETTPGHFIIALSYEVRNGVMIEICPKQYVCATKDIGVVIDIERKRK